MAIDRIEGILDDIPAELAAGASIFGIGNAPLDESSSLDDSSSAPDADTEVFNRFLDGSDEAFRQLYDAFERPLYLYVVRLLGTKSDAEDVFQDVWTRMYRLRGEEKTVQKFSGLLFTVARNLSFNAIRDRKLHPGISIEEVPETELAARSGDVEGLDLRDMLERAMLRLPVAQREAFILREYFGYTYQEVGEITGTSLVGAKTRAWRARERLRKMMAAWLELPEQ